MHDDPFGCDLNFTVLVEEGTTATAAELALYKKAEADTGSHIAYLVYILYKELDQEFSSSILGQRYIPSSCKSWQVFNISNLTDNLPVGVHKFNLLVAVFKETSFGELKPPPLLSCNEVKSLFVMDTSADINKFQETESEASGPEEPENDTSEELNEVDENGKEKSNKDNNDNETELEEMTSSGSGGGEDLVAMTTSTPPIVEDLITVEDYLPTLVVFISGGPNPLQLTKRSAIQIEQNKTDTYGFSNVGEDTTAAEDSDESSGANCRLLENKIDLPALNPNILLPEIVDIGKCSNSTERVECKPTAFRNLETLQKDIESGISIVVVLENYIITECTPCAIIPPPSTDDSTSSGSTIDDSQKEMDSDKIPMVTEPAGTETEADLDKGGSGESKDANCSLLKNETQLSTISPYITDPKSYDSGKCSESTDTVECRPTGFGDLTVTLHINGTTTLETLQNVVITECTPFLNTPNL